MNSPMGHPSHPAFSDLSVTCPDVRSDDQLALTRYPEGDEELVRVSGRRLREAATAPDSSVTQVLLSAVSLAATKRALRRGFVR